MCLRSLFVTPPKSEVLEYAIDVKRDTPGSKPIIELRKVTCSAVRYRGGAIPGRDQAITVPTEKLCGKTAMSFRGEPEASLVGLWPLACGTIGVPPWRETRSGVVRRKPNARIVPSCPWTPSATSFFPIWQGNIMCGFWEMWSNTAIPLLARSSAWQPGKNPERGALKSPPSPPPAQ